MRLYYLEKKTENTYKVYQKVGEQYEFALEIKADEVIELEFCFLALNDGYWSMHALSFEGFKYLNNYYKVGSFKTFLTGITKFFHTENMFFYETNLGWYYFDYMDAFWNISNPAIYAENLKKAIHRLCDTSENIVKCNTLYNTRMYVIITDKRHYLTFSHQELGRVLKSAFKIEEIDRCDCGIVKIFENQNSNLFSLQSIFVKQLKLAEVIESAEYLGDRYFSLQRAGKTKLIYVDRFEMKTVLDFGLYKVHLIDNNISNNSCKKLLISSNEENMIVNLSGNKIMQREYFSDD